MKPLRLWKLFESGDADFEAYTAAGINELKKGNPDEALSLLIDATSLERNYSRAYAFLAVAHLHAGEPEIAFRQLEMAESLDPNDPLPNIIASQIHAGLFQTEKAISQAEKVKEKSGSEKELMGSLRTINKVVQMLEEGF